jgi:hypothetical protein|tara:strand:+ start:16445 stop:17068 length:624 start_codon:yes stop_codon:yes gene_type:complete
MGFDLHGLSPQGITDFVEPDWSDPQQVAEHYKLKSTIEGAYFRNSVWYWRPLWACVCSLCEDILTEEDETSGGFNDGYIISAEKSCEIYQRLKEAIADGRVNAMVEHHHTISDEAEDEPCDVCKGTGTRKGWEGWQSKSRWLKYHESLDKTETKPTTSYKNAHELKGCNACRGRGKQRPFFSNYVLTLDNIEEFMGFCRNSGGFRIW